MNYASSLAAAGFITATTFAIAPAAAEQYLVDPEAGNSTMSAVFDAPLGERINAISSAVSCDFDVDRDKGTLSGKCTVPLISVMVDGNATKTDHFYDWVTNKANDLLKCNFELDLGNVKANGPMEPKKPVAYEIKGAFTVCGRAHDKGAKETITGTVVFLPKGTYGKSDTLRVRAKIAKFNRESYKIGPGFTKGWLARVQMLANVVAAEGAIEVNLFAKLKNGSTSQK